MKNLKNVKNIQKECRSKSKRKELGVFFVMCLKHRKDGCSYEEKTNHFHVDDSDNASFGGDCS